MQREINVKKEEYVDRLLEEGGTGRNFYEAKAEMAGIGHVPRQIPFKYCYFLPVY